MSGDGDTVHAGSYTPATGFTTTGSSVARYVFDLGDWDNSGWVEPHGTSGLPGAPHHHDQVDSWLNNDLYPAIYSWKRIQADSSKTILLS
jgi:penicillin amidase